MSLAINGVQIETMMRCCSTPIRMTTIKNNGNTKYWHGCEEVDYSGIGGGNVNDTGTV